MTTRTAILGLLCTTALGACETQVVVNGTVTVSADVVKSFSSERRGRVLVEVRLPDVRGFRSIGVVCGGEAPVDLPFHFSSIGCASEGTLTAWVETAEAKDGALPECGPQ